MLPFPAHPHMLKHSTGYKLANDGHDTRSLAHYLGHRNLQSAARYTALAPDRFAKFLAGLDDRNLPPVPLDGGAGPPLCLRGARLFCDGIILGQNRVSPVQDQFPSHEPFGPISVVLGAYSSIVRHN
jgi:hypothetical protein